MLPALLVRLPRRLPKPAKLLRDLYPMLMMPAFWTEIDLLFPLRHTEAFDGFCTCRKEPRMQAPGR